MSSSPAGLIRPEDTRQSPLCCRWEVSLGVPDYLRISHLCCPSLSRLSLSAPASPSHLHSGELTGSQEAGWLCGSRQSTFSLWVQDPRLQSEIRLGTFCPPLPLHLSPPIPALTMWDPLEGDRPWSGRTMGLLAAPEQGPLVQSLALGKTAALGGVSALSSSCASAGRRVGSAHPGLWASVPIPHGNHAEQNLGVRVSG